MSNLYSIIELTKTEATECIARNDFETARTMMSVLELLNAVPLRADFLGLAAEEIRLLKTDSMVAAIKAYRHRTAKGLKESKDAVEAYIAAHNLRRVDGRWNYVDP